jgi:hypothetical protein
MTMYEVIVSQPDHQAVIIDGREELLEAWEFLRNEASRGLIPGTGKIGMFEEIFCPPEIARTLLERFSKNSSWLSDDVPAIVMLTEL